MSITSSREFASLDTLLASTRQTHHKAIELLGPLLVDNAQSFVYTPIRSGTPPMLSVTEELEKISPKGPPTPAKRALESAGQRLHVAERMLVDRNKKAERTSPSPVKTSVMSTTSPVSPPTGGSNGADEVGSEQLDLLEYAKRFGHTVHPDATYISWERYAEAAAEIPFVDSEQKTSDVPESKD